MLDLSGLLRPETTLTPADGKDAAAFRDYSEANALNERVRRTYGLMHQNQTVEFVRGKVSKRTK